MSTKLEKCLSLNHFKKFNHKLIFVTPEVYCN